ncbi:MAG: FAD-dependent monooxygenase [Rubellimicrobium sp.]|nr:FAD-dependent monooxygenase [Rubellimicrobium sp.]
MRIGIAGAGIGGLAAAALLADGGHEVTVLDRFDAPRPVGSGLVIQPVGAWVLDEIGCGDAARGLGQRLTRMLGHEAGTGRPVLDVSYAPREGLAIHRASLFEVLWQAVLRRQVTLLQGAEITGREGAYLLAGQARLGPFDLIVDAAGASSPLSPIKARPLAYGALWATVDWPETNLPPDELRQRYRRADRMIGILPIGRLPGDGRNKAALFWSLPVAQHADWLERGPAVWRDEARALWPEAEPFLAQIGDPARMTMARYSHGTLARPWSDGLVHIGDAAHRASPQLGQGANMALLDALALAWALRLANGQDPLALYAAARRWHVRAYQAFSAAFTPQYQSDSRILPVIRDRVLFPLSQVPPLPRVLTALVCGTMLPPLASLDRAAGVRARRSPGHGR